MIPCRRAANNSAKVPAVAWREYQQRRADESEIAAWLNDYGNPNVAVVTGRVSGVVVIDCDSDEAVTLITSMLDVETTSVTTGKGRHFYFRHPGFTLGNRTHIMAGVDVRGDGGYVLAPDSLHPSGRSYVWITPPWECPPAPLPERLMAILTAPRCRPDRPPGGQIREGVSVEASADSGTIGKAPGMLRNYALVALRAEVERLKNIPLPDGNGKERKMAASSFRMGQLIPYGYLNEEMVMGEFLRVWCDRWGKPLHRGVRTITYGLSSGIKQPRRISQQSRNRT